MSAEPQETIDPAPPEPQASATPESGPVLRRMTGRAAETLAAGRAGALARPVSIMLGKVTRAVMGLPSTASDIAVNDLELAQVPSHVPRGALMIILAAGSDPVGLVAIDAGVAAALVEFKLTGLLAARSGRARLVTEIDAELLRDVVDAALGGLADLTPDGRKPLNCHHHLADIRALPYILPAEDLQVLELQLSLGEGETAGQAMFLLPAGYMTGGAGARPQRPKPGMWRDHLRDAVEGAAVPLEGILHRWRLPLETLRALAPGDRLDLPREAIGEVALMAKGRLHVLSGRLGQARGQRAVRIGPHADTPLTLDD